ncbi:MAG: hypothetical protein N2971_06355 [Chlorobi bacterium]|nr:hypothetical protein [Chlorobiota bacterium]
MPLGWVLIVVVGLTSCSTLSLRRLVTRTERDVYTVTLLDTTTVVEYTNAPGERGVLYPSNRTYRTDRHLNQYDSVVERYYPNFIRVGVFESVGLIATGPTDRAIAGGIFGIYTDPDDAFSTEIQPRRSLFTGGIYRYGTVEFPLYWFDEPPTWSIGFTTAEIYQFEASNERAVVGAFPISIRKRHFLRDEIPYLSITGTATFGFFPSQYLHLAGSFDAGSLGGLNLRTYGGIVIGRSIEQKSIVQPYLGMGVSLLDFLNHPRELQRQWEEHEHSSWNIGFARLMPFLLMTGTDTAATSPSIGLQLRLMPTTIAFPVGDHQLCVGTELLSAVFAFRQQLQNGTGFGYGILPVRVGYWMPIGDGWIAIEPYGMFSYFPHTMWQVALRANFNALEWLPLGVELGYVSSSGFTVRRGTVADIVGNNILAFNVGYLGISIGIAEEIFRPAQLRYYRRQH